MNTDTENPKLYLETTISSYLTARESRDIIQLARQQITAEWWNNRLNDFDVFISQIVIDEASSGDPDAARKRTCRHIANAEKIKAFESICKSEGYELPVICTPEEFSERP